MRTLESPPSSVVGPDGVLRAGSFRGSLPHVDLAPLRKGPLYRLTHHKRWVYLALVQHDLFVGMAVVDLGYAKNTFAFAYERGANDVGRMLVDRSAVGHPAAGSVGDGIGPGFAARFSAGRTRVEVRRVANELEIDADYGATEGPDLQIRARIVADVPHPALSAIGPIPGGVVDATEKHALLGVHGEVVVGGRSRRLEGGTAGWDYTNGYLARHTKWRWAYLLGRARDGATVGLNLVEGFLGDKECGVWIDGALHPVGEGRFTFDANDPLAPWRVRTTDGAVDLKFTPGGMHAEKTDFKIVRSRFVQPVGVYDGTIRVGGRELVLERVLGVAEDQDVLW